MISLPPARAYDTADSTRKCLQQGYCTPAMMHTLQRAVLMGMGMAIAGQRKHLIRNALAGSAAVTAFIGWWVSTHPNQPLPSVIAVRRGDLPGMAASLAGRAAIVGGGLRLAGEAAHTTRDSIAAVAAIELGLLIREAGT